MVEADAGKATIKDHKMKIVREIIKFIYTGKVDKINDKNAEALFKAANQFLLEGMKNICELYLMSKVTLDNAIDMMALGHVYQADGLKKRAKEIIVEAGLFYLGI